MTDVPNTALAANVGLLRDGLKVLGGLLMAHGAIGQGHTITQQSWEIGAGVIVALAPIAYSYWLKFWAAKDVKVREAIAGQAALNMAAAGAAIILKDPQTGIAFPKPITLESMSEIISNFGPSTKPAELDTQIIPTAVKEAAVLDAISSATAAGASVSHV